MICALNRIAESKFTIIGQRDRILFSFVQYDRQNQAENLLPCYGHTVAGIRKDHGLDEPAALRNLRTPATGNRPGFCLSA